VSGPEERLRLAHAWMTVRALRLLESRGVDLSADDAKAVVDYVCEQALADVIELASTFKRSVLLHDVMLLTAIIRLGHAPEKDATPMPAIADATADGPPTPATPVPVGEAPQTTSTGALGAGE
jgi:uncharacterized protein YggE